MSYQSEQLRILASERDGLSQILKSKNEEENVNDSLKLEIQEYMSQLATLKNQFAHKEAENVNLKSFLASLTSLYGKEISDLHQVMFCLFLIFRKLEMI